MKGSILFIVVFIALSLATGCRTATKIQYVPVESERIEYRDKVIRDSIIRYDSIYIRDKGDTVWIEKYGYLYRDRIVKDSIFIQDTIRVPYRVDVPGPKENYVTGWQNFQIWCGRGLLLSGLLFLVVKGIRRKFRL